MYDYEIRKVPANYRHIRDDRVEYTRKFVASVKKNGYEATIAKMDVPSAIYWRFSEELNSEYIEGESWYSPKEERNDDEGCQHEYIELCCDYEDKLEIALRKLNSKEYSEKDNLDIYFPDPRKYMLVGVPKKERTHYMMFDIGESRGPDKAGVPISPPCESKEAVAEYLNEKITYIDCGKTIDWKDIVFQEDTQN